MSSSLGVPAGSGQFRHLTLNFARGLARGQSVSFGIDRDLAVSGFGGAGPAFAAGHSGGSSARHSGLDGAQVVSERRVADRIVDLTVQSPALGRTAIVRLVTPDGWDQRRRGQRWPVLYLLHGCCDTPDSWTRETDVEEIPALRNVLVVTPEGGAVGWYSDWWNHGAGGPPAWETFHLSEVRRLLERGYGAGKQRVIAGLSMGGAGAMTYASRHRGMFRAAASYSGVVHPLADPYGLLDGFRFFGAEDPLAIWGDPLAQVEIWIDHDPVYLARSLRGIGLFLAVGNGIAGPFDPPGTFDGNEAFLQAMNIALFARLKQLHIPVTTDFYGPGTHTWPYWERELHRSLPMLLDALGRETRSAHGDRRARAAVG